MSKSNKTKKTIEKTEEKIKDFGDLLDSLKSTTDKKKLLWKDAYRNALDDRMNAELLLTDIIFIINGSSANHSTHGMLATKYMERMSKANDQILKLAELVSKEQEKEEAVSDDYLYDSIGS